MLHIGFPVSMIDAIQEMGRCGGDLLEMEIMMKLRQMFTLYWLTFTILFTWASGCTKKKDNNDIKNQKELFLWTKIREDIHVNFWMCLNHLFWSMNALTLVLKKMLKFNNFFLILFNIVFTDVPFVIIPLRMIYFQ